MSSELSPIVPFLHYADVDEAVMWLPRVFRLGLARVQHGADGAAMSAELTLGTGRIYLRQTDGATALSGGRMYVYVHDVDEHCSWVRSCGVTATDPQDQPWGDRVYDTADFQGTPWTFAQSLVDR